MAESSAQYSPVELYFQVRSTGVAPAHRGLQPQLPLRFLERKDVMGFEPTYSELKARLTS